MEFNKNKLLGGILLIITPTMLLADNKEIIDENTFPRSEKGKRSQLDNENKSIRQQTNQNPVIGDNINSLPTIDNNDTNTIADGQKPLPKNGASGGTIGSSQPSIGGSGSDGNSSGGMR